MLKAYMQEHIRIIENHLSTLLETKGTSENLIKAMRYSLMAGGKRLRPIMLLAVIEALEGDRKQFLDLACSLEFIHTYSLIHDDLPAMDNDDLRRGKPTCHKVFGDAMAILAGDALLTEAFSLVVKQKKLANEVKIEIIKELSYASGMCGMVGGQAIDMESNGKENKLNKEYLVKMHEMKTGALFCAAVRMGAMAVLADQKKITAFTEYAKNFGLAFQITDDILDAVGDEKLLGKPIGSDVKNDKLTYLRFYSLEDAKKEADKAIEKSIQSISFLGEKAWFFKDLVVSLRKRKK